MCGRGKILYHGSLLCTVTGTLSPKYITELVCVSQSSPLQRMLVLVKDAFNVFLQSQLRYGDHSGVNDPSTGLSCPKPHDHPAPWENHVLHPISVSPTNPPLNLLLQPSLPREWGFPSLCSSPSASSPSVSSPLAGSWLRNQPGIWHCSPFPSGTKLSWVPVLLQGRMRLQEIKKGFSSQCPR